MTIFLWFYMDFQNSSVYSKQIGPRSTIHMSLWQCRKPPSLSRIQIRSPWSREKRRPRRSFLFRPAEALSTAMEGWGSTRRSPRTAGHLGWPGEGPWQLDHVHTSATAAVAGGRLLRRSSTSAEPARDAQHDAASEVALTVSVEEARSGGNGTMTSLACRPWWTAPWALQGRWREPGRSGEIAIHSGGGRDAWTSSKGGGGLNSRMDAMHQRRVRPLRHSTEHVSSSEVAQVGRVFGLFTNRFGLWTKNEGCCTRPTLHFLFKVHSH